MNLPVSVSVSKPTLRVPTIPNLRTSATSGVNAVAASAAGSVNSAVSNAAGSIQRAVLNPVYRVNGILANLKAILAGVKALATAGTKISIPSLQYGVSTAILTGLEKQVTSMIAGAVDQAVRQAIGKIEGLTLGQLQKSLDPVYNAISSVESVLGKTAAATTMAQAVFTTSPAKAELLARAYFKNKF